jgi:hypothetical protein
MTISRTFAPAFLFTAIPTLFAQAMDMKSCPMMQGDQHSKGVDYRGDQAMGFSHEKTAHHFRLFSDGGSIDVIVKSKSDSEQVAAIRSHLKMIAGMFSQGDFHLPMFIHDRVVPGQKTMESMRTSITYTFASLSDGGRVRIQTKDPRALTAIHGFLVFQVKDHRTGDSGRIEKP